jgi:hypothetical protein
MEQRKRMSTFNEPILAGIHPDASAAAGADHAAN